MPLVYEVTGHSRQSGLLVSSDDGLGSYPLSEAQVTEIARVLETEIDQSGSDFFLEPYEQPRSAAG
jgi:hypothetical protein